MARDYLSIQGAATPVERIWSSAAETDTKRRNRLSPNIFSTLQFFKGAYRRYRRNNLSKEEEQKLREGVIREMLDEDWYNDTSDDAASLVDQEFNFYIT